MKTAVGPHELILIILPPYPREQAGRSGTNFPSSWTITPIQGEVAPIHMLPQEGVMEATSPHFLTMIQLRFIMT